MLLWVALNAVQAACLGVDADEAYYWLYAQHLDWGYFDHPPLVALSIALGETFGHGPFFTRMGSIVLSTGTVYFGYKLLPQRLASLRWYLLLFSAFALFHVYGFIATPDSGLLFFTTLFFYAYKRYLEKETTAHTLLLAFSLAGLLYSKYHGVLPILFTLLSNPKLILKRSAWVAVLLAFIAFSPHLWWQYQHGWPTVHFHLFERVSRLYRPSKTLGYIGGQLLIWGPFTTIPLLLLSFKRGRDYSRYERAHVFTAAGVFLFFFGASFRSSVQLHWTLVAGPSLMVLLLHALHTAPHWKGRTAVLAAIQVALLLVGRMLFLVPQAPVYVPRSFAALQQAPVWTAAVQRAAQGRPVVFADSYRFAALYRYYYPAADVGGYNTAKYRRTGFNIWSDAFLNNRTVVLASPEWWPGSTLFFKSPYTHIYLQTLDSFKAVNALRLEWRNPVRVIKKGQRHAAVVSLHNFGKDTIRAGGLLLNYTFLQTGALAYTPATTVPIPAATLPPGYRTELRLPLQPPPAYGTYRIVFSIVQCPLSGTFASPFYEVAVE